MITEKIFEKKKTKPIVHTHIHIYIYRLLERVTDEDRYHRPYSKIVHFLNGKSRQQKKKKKINKYP
jgi:hypothetical protein